ncbi:complement factor B-like [Antedon mediterranea]|uniref:complement factor B-like n=1 Tax=Antedon mediterranea TaxID=105859 RepID=UPI003AF5AC4B
MKRIILLFTLCYVLRTSTAVKTCPMPEDLENGSYTFSKRGNKIGGFVTFSCNPGYNLAGQAKIKCLKSTTDWAAEFPSCQPGVRCPGVVSEIANGEVIIEEGEMIVGTQVKFDCKRGFYIPSELKRSIVCQDDGTWDGEVPMCNQSMCELPTLNIPNGFVIDAKNGTYFSNDPLYYGCDEGYKIRGAWQVCKPSKGTTGGWEGDVPRCEFVTCSWLPEIENGRKSANLINVGNVVKFYCSSGYRIHGSSQRTCLKNGRWDGTDPVCVRISNPTDCMPLPTPINGAKSGTRYNLNDYVEFSCNAGYTRIGEPLRKCLDSGWSGETVTCEAPDQYSDLEKVKAAFIQNFDALKTVTHTNEMVEAEKERIKEEACNGTSEEECQRGRLIDLNYQGRLEVYFVFDASQSVGQENFDTSKRFVKSVITKLGVGSREKGPLYGIVVYSNDATVYLQLTQYQNVSTIHKVLDKDVIYEGKGTNTNAGLNALLENVIPTAKRNLPETDLEPQRAVFLLTDGESNTGGKPYKLADKLREEHDAKIHCIGISENVNKEELRDIANTPNSEYYFHLGNYPDLEELAHAIVSEEYDYSSCGIGGSNVKSLGRIFGGNDANDGAWPWQVAFYEETGINNQDFFCGGTLISDEWILTAAHCFDRNPVAGIAQGKDWQTTTAYLGLTDLVADIGSSQSYGIERMIKHENYDTHQSPVFDYDVALLKLNAPAYLSPRIRTACLPDVTDTNLNTEYKLEGGKVTVTGWGRTEEVNINAKLQELIIGTQSYDDCNEGVQGQFSSRMFCAGGEAGKDACQGDSGGPVVRGIDSNGEVRYEVVGVVSWGRECGVAGQYGYYTHVPKLRSWIKEKTGL